MEDRREFIKKSTLTSLLVCLSPIELFSIDFKNIKPLLTLEEELEIKSFLLKRHNIGILEKMGEEKNIRLLHESFLNKTYDTYRNVNNLSVRKAKSKLSSVTRNYDPYKPIPINSELSRNFMLYDFKDDNSNETYQDLNNTLRHYFNWKSEFFKVLGTDSGEKVIQNYSNVLKSLSNLMYLANGELVNTIVSFSPFGGLLTTTSLNTNNDTEVINGNLNSLLNMLSNDFESILNNDSFYSGVYVSQLERDLNNIDFDYLRNDLNLKGSSTNLLKKVIKNTISEKEKSQLASELIESIGNQFTDIISTELQKQRQTQYLNFEKQQLVSSLTRLGYLVVDNLVSDSDGDTKVILNSIISASSQYAMLSISAAALKLTVTPIGWAAVAITLVSALFQKRSKSDFLNKAFKQIGEQLNIINTRLVRIEKNQYYILKSLAQILNSNYENFNLLNEKIDNLKKQNDYIILKVVSQDFRDERKLLINPIDELINYSKLTIENNGNYDEYLDGYDKKIGGEIKTIFGNCTKTINPLKSSAFSGSNSSTINDDFIKKELLFEKGNEFIKKTPFVDLHFKIGLLKNLHNTGSSFELPNLQLLNYCINQLVYWHSTFPKAHNKREKNLQYDRLNGLIENIDETLRDILGDFSTIKKKSESYANAVNKSVSIIYQDLKKQEAELNTDFNKVVEKKKDTYFNEIDVLKLKTIGKNLSRENLSYDKYHIIKNKLKSLSAIKSDRIDKFKIYEQIGWENQNIWMDDRDGSIKNKPNNWKEYFKESLHYNTSINNVDIIELAINLDIITILNATNYKGYGRPKNYSRGLHYPERMQAKELKLIKPKGKFKNLEGKSIIFNDETRLCQITAFPRKFYTQKTTFGGHYVNYPKDFAVGGLDIEGTYKSMNFAFFPNYPNKGKQYEMQNSWKVQLGIEKDDKLKNITFIEFLSELIQEEFKDKKYKMIEESLKNSFNDNLKKSIDSEGLRLMFFSKVNQQYTQLNSDFAMDCISYLYTSDDFIRHAKEFANIDFEEGGIELYRTYKKLEKEYKNKDIEDSRNIFTLELEDGIKQLNSDNYIDFLIIYLKNKMLQTIDSSYGNCKEIIKSDIHPLLADSMEKLKWFKKTHKF